LSHVRKAAEKEGMQQYLLLFLSLSSPFHTCLVQVRHKHFLAWLKPSIAGEGDETIETRDGDNGGKEAEVVKHGGVEGGRDEGLDD
jgi:hypothetical protein